MTMAGHHVRVIMFDLDGTLIDSRPGIESSVRAALEELGLERVAPIEDSWLGLPLGGLIEALLPDAGPDDRALAVRAYARHYDEVGWRSSRPYVGVEPLVERLRQDGIRAFIVTGKRRTPTLAILSRFGLISHFEAVYTLDSRIPGYSSKVEMGQACIEDHALDASSTLVVGDSRDDLEMARACGTLFAAASWGYGGVGKIDAAHRASLRSSSAPLGPPDVFLEGLTDLETLVHEEVGGRSRR